MQNWTPIRRVLAGFVAAGIWFVARQLGVDLGDGDVNKAADTFVGILIAYSGVYK